MNKFSKILSVAAFSFFLTGCVSPLAAKLSGDYNILKSESDDIIISPGLLGTNTVTGLGLIYNSRNHDTFFITRVQGNSDIQELIIQVDGQFFPHQSAEPTHFGIDGLYGEFSFKKFKTNRGLVKEIMKGRRVIVEIITDQIHTKDSFHETCSAPQEFSLGIEIIGACQLFSRFIEN